MKNLFKQIEETRIKRNVFDLTHDHKLTGKMGLLIPTLALEAVPNDTFEISGDALARFAPIIAPIMHRVNLTMHYFFVPNRIVWDGWEDFITNTDPTGVPYLEVDAEEPLTEDQWKLLGHFGIPRPTNVDQTQSARFSAIPFAAYQKIYNEYYRDENLVPEVPDQLVSGFNDYNDFVQFRLRAWEHDYYTACLPWSQKGQAVSIPLGQIELDPNWNGTPTFEEVGGGTLAGNIDQTTGINVASSGPSAYNPDGSLIVQNTTITDLRRAMKLQEWLEKNARGGTRYSEQILAQFGVKSSDARLQRPEYITGVKAPVVISEVLSTAGTFDALDPATPTSPPTGNMAGHGAAVAAGKFGKFFCEEHGWIIGILNVQPKTAYQQGIPRSFMKFDALDYYWRSFAHIGEQGVMQNEIYAYANGMDEMPTFGYIPRYAEYKYMPSRVSGDFINTLNYWHLGRVFQNSPQLNQEFIECNPEDCNRIFAVQDETDNLYIHVLHKIKAIRPMPYFGTPMI